MNWPLWALVPTMVVQTSEPILERNKVSGHLVKIKTGEMGELDNSIKNPFSPVNPWNLVCFMFMLHRRKGLLPLRPRQTYLGQAKKLIDRVGPDEAEDLMLKAAKMSRYPWGFAFIERLRQV